MSDRSGIEWCDATVSAVRGCWPVSPGCLNCYATGIAARFSGEGQTYEALAAFRGKPGARRARWSGAISLHREQLWLPLRWQSPRVIFWNHTSDTWHQDVPDEYIAAMFGVAAATPQHTHIFLTKRAERVPYWFAWLAARGPSLHPAGAARGARWYAWNYDLPSERLFSGEFHDWPWPLPNVIGMVSVEDRRHGLPRIEHLRQAPFAMRGLSIEPLLEDLGTLDLRHIDWVIVGGESGRFARTMQADWARSIRDQCVAAGVPFFFKQWGNKEAGRELDGRLWAERPLRFARSEVSR